MKKYPLKISYISKPAIWSGTRLVRQWGKLSESDRIAETWELSVRPKEMAIVLEGEAKGVTLQSYIEQCGADCVFPQYRLGDRFPLLIKLIDAADRLSVQVHPDDELASERHDSFGKTEMWYIADAEEGAVIYLGFNNKKITREEYIKAVAEGTVADILQAVPVKKGDVFFIPTGTVHALAKGLNVIEIQQTSDITYRIFDWNRVDSEGKSRELHTALAVDAINFESGVEECRRTYTPVANNEVNIVDCEFFKTDMLVVDGVAELDYCKRDSFTIYMCIEGDVKVTLDNGTSDTLRTGEVMLVPAIANEVIIEGKAQILASHL